MSHELSTLPGPFAASERTSPKSFAQPIATGFIMAVAFVTVFLAALHSPKPHGIPIGLTGPPNTVSGVKAAVDKAQPGAYRFHTYTDSETATEALHNRDVYGVLDVTSPGRAQIDVAGANGAGTVTPVETTLKHVGSQLKLATQVHDQVPLPSGDRNGLAAFYFVFGIALSSYLFAQAFHEAEKEASLPARLGVPLLFSVLLGVVLTFIADAVFGAAVGHPWTVIGVTVLLSLAIVTATSALTRLIGNMGVALAGLLFIVLGNATSGGALNWHFLPGGWRWISQKMPTGAAVASLQDLLYFDKHHLGTAVLTLLAWIAVSVVFLIGLPLLGQDAVQRAHKRTTQNSNAMNGDTASSRRTELTVDELRVELAMESEPNGVGSKS